MDDFEIGDILKEPVDNRRYKVIGKFRKWHWLQSIDQLTGSVSTYGMPFSWSSQVGRSLKKVEPKWELGKTYHDAVSSSRFTVVHINSDGSAVTVWQDQDKFWSTVRTAKSVSLSREVEQ